jgi:hypothetical protein
MSSTQDTATRIVIPMEDDPLHTSLSPFCSDPTCPCHESPDLLEMVAEAVQEGLLTPAEATAFVAGKTI